MAARVTRAAPLALVLLLVAAPARARDFSAVDEAAGDAVASGELPGAVVLVGQGDRVLFHRAYGARRLLPAPQPMTEDTIFDLASLTKPLGTTLAVMALVERGRVALDAPLGRYLREFGGRAFREVTVRRLLTHSAGLAAYPASGAVAAGFPAAAGAPARLPLSYAPGTGFQYSDSGFILLGELVRRVSGERLDRYLERVVFGPLGLRDTSFRPAAAARARVAPTAWANGRLLVGEVHDPRARLLGGVAGHTGMFSTAADVARLPRKL